MKTGLGWIILGVCLIIGAAVIGNAYKYKFKLQDRIVVTGLGEQEFTSDLIVWNGWITQRSDNAADGYQRLEESRGKVEQFIRERGLDASGVVFMFVDVMRDSEPVYGPDGSYRGQKFTGYVLRQQFTVESTDVDLVESISREISALIAQGVSLESRQPDYYFSKLDDLKHELIEKATRDARKRAEKIASESGSKLKNLVNARLGVFQITGANANEEFSAMGNFNTSSKNKKARVTVRLEYMIK